MWVHPSLSSFFLFRYGIDVKKVPFLSQLGGQKLLLLCKCFIANVLIQQFMRLLPMCPDSSAYSVNFPFWTSKTLHFFRTSSVLHPSVKAFWNPSSSLYSYVSSVVYHISKHLISFATKWSAACSQRKAPFCLSILSL